MSSLKNKATAFSLAQRQLPPGDSLSLHITHPTTSEQYKHTLANSQEWKGALSVEAYLRREEHLASLDLTREGGITFWVLVDRDENVADEADRTVLAGCETLHKRAWISQHGTLEEATCHGVASVFGPPEHRGRGYGERLIRELAKVLETWQRVEGRRQLSILYSDIGKTFYSKSGWHPYSSSHVLLPPSSEHGLRDADPASTQRITASNLPKFCDLASAHIYDELLARTNESDPAFALVPDLATISWHHAREDFVAQELFGRTPEVKGAYMRVPAATGQQEGQAFALWTRMWYNPNVKQTQGNTLHILRLDVKAVKNTTAHVPAIMALLRAAQQQATGWLMSEVEIWSPEPETLEACRRLLEPRPQDSADIDAEQGIKRDIKDAGQYGRLVHREKESIACLKWYGDGEMNTDAATGRVAELEWIANEKFGWC